MLYRCACGKSASEDGELCAECRAQQEAEGALQRMASSEGAAATANFSFSNIPLHAPAPGAASSSLAISQPDDPAEIEAGQIANTVMRMTDGESAAAIPAAKKVHPLNRSVLARQQSQTAPPEQHDFAPPLVHQVLSGSGHPLDHTVRAQMEPRFGFDFSQVRVHRHAQAEDSADAVGARAYTVGNDVVFGAGQYSPETSSGQHLIAHELAHVVQNSTTSVQRLSRASKSQNQVQKCAPNPWLMARQNNEPHRLIQLDFLATTSAGGNIEFGVPYGGPMGGTGFADLVHMDDHELYEIKPNNLAGRTLGLLTIARYVAFTNQFCRSNDKSSGWIRGKSYLDTPKMVGTTSAGEDVWAWRHRLGLIVYETVKHGLPAPVTVPIPGRAKKDQRSTNAVPDGALVPSSISSLPLTLLLLAIVLLAIIAIFFPELLPVIARFFIGRSLPVVLATIGKLDSDSLKELENIGIPADKAQRILQILKALKAPDAAKELEKLGLTPEQIEQLMIANKGGVAEDDDADADKGIITSMLNEVEDSSTEVADSSEKISVASAGAN